MEVEKGGGRGGEKERERERERDEGGTPLWYTSYMVARVGSQLEPTLSNDIKALVSKKFRTVPVYA